MKVTASKRYLLHQCQYPWRGDHPWDETSGRPAKEGTAVHVAIEHHGESGLPLPRLAKRLVPGYVAACEFIDSIGVDKVRREVAYGANPATGEAVALPKGEARDYGDWPVGGTIDLEYPVSANEVAIVDWKTGNDHPADYDAQMQTLAAMSGAKVARLAFIGSGDIVWRDVEVLPEAEVMASLAADVAAIPDAFPQPGEHCSASFCPIRKVCPAAEITPYKWSRE